MTSFHNILLNFAHKTVFFFYYYNTIIKGGHYEKKLISLFISLTFFTTFAIPKIIYASVPEEYGNQSVKYINVSLLPENLETPINSIPIKPIEGEEIITPSSVTVASTVALFVAGVFVGYVFAIIVDGIMISFTGCTGGEVVARYISMLRGKPYRPAYYFTSNGGGGGFRVSLVTE